MKKLSKILESIWSDMQDRGTRDIMKVEDDTKIVAMAKAIREEEVEEEDSEQIKI